MHPYSMAPRKSETISNVLFFNYFCLKFPPKTKLILGRHTVFNPVQWLSDVVSLLPPSQK